MKRIFRNYSSRSKAAGLAGLLAAAAFLGFSAPRLSAQTPYTVDGELAFASGLVKLGMTDYAEKVMAELIRKNPGAAERASVVKAEIAIRKRDFAAADEMLKKLPKGSPKAQAIQLSMANALYGMGESAKAIALYNEFFKAYGDKIPTDEDVLRSYVQASYTQSVMAKNSGDKAGVVKALERVLKAKPDRDVKLSMSIELGNALVELAKDTKDAKQKEAYLKRAEELAETVTFAARDLLFGQAIGIMANAQYARGNRAEAIKLIDDFYPDVAEVEGLLKRAGEDMKFSPLAPLRYLRGELHMEDAKAAFAGGNQKAGIQAIGKAGTEFYNVFIKYSGSEWSEKAGLKYNEANDVLEKATGKRFKAEIASKKQQGQVAKGKLTLGDSLFKSKKYTEAIDEYLPVLNAYPEVKMVPAALYNLALAYIETDQPLYARMVIEYLAERFSQHDEAAMKVLVLGSKFYKQKTDKSADEKTREKYEVLFETAYSSFAKSFPDHDKAPQALYLLAETARQKGNIERSNELYEVIAERYPGDRNYLKALNRIAFGYFNAKEYVKAADYFGRYIEAARPGYDQAQARFRKAYSLGQEGNLKQALSEFNKLKADLSDKSSESPYRQGGGDDKIDGVLEQTVLNLAQLLATIPPETPGAEKIYAMAVSNYGEFLEQFPKSELAPVGMYGQGKLQVRLGNFDGATATFNKLAEKYPNSPQGKSAYYSLVQASIESDQSEVAKEAVNKMLAKSTEYSADEFIRVGQLMLDNKFYEEAMRSMEIVSKHPDAQDNDTIQQMSLFGLAKAQNRLGDFSGSAATLDAFLEKYPKSALFFDIKLMAADSLRGEGRLDEAKLALKEVYKFAKQKTDSMKADLAMAQIHAAGEDFEPALASYMKVVFFGDPKIEDQQGFINDAVVEGLEMAQKLNRWDKVKELCDTYINYFPRGDKIKEIRKLLAQAKLRAATSEVETPEVTE